MGNDKAFLRLGEETLLARLLRSLRRAFRQVLVSASNDAVRLETVRSTLPGELRAATRIIPDGRDRAGPLEGLRASLAALPSDRAFFVAIDMPVVPIAIVRLLWERCESSGGRGAVPRRSGRLEPAFAVYSKGLLANLDRALEDGQRDLRQVAGWPGVNVVDLDDPAHATQLEGIDRERLFWNVNEPADYERLLEAFARGEVSEEAVV